MVPVLEAWGSLNNGNSKISSPNMHTGKDRQPHAELLKSKSEER